MNNRFTVILIALVIAFGAIFFFTKNKADAPTDVGNQSSGQPTEHLYGEGKKGVTLVEYGDFQCPACGAYYPLVKQVVEKYKADITFQFVNFPIVSRHPNAMAAHRAAEAAGLQGKYWEMYDLLYSRLSNWTDSSNVAPIFQGYATELGLNMTKYQQDVASSVINDAINADLKKGKDTGVTGTPTFVLDGKKIDQNPQDADTFGKLIENAIAAKSPQPAQ